MIRDPQTLQSTDPRLEGLLRAGYVIVGESWGARLRLTDPLDLSAAIAAIEKATAQGFAVQELDASWARQVTALEALTYDDYPRTPATGIPHRTEPDVQDLWATGCRLFGATDAGRLAAVSAIKDGAERAETDFTSVHPAYRRRGLAVAVKAASIAALGADGVRVFGTGGAQANIGSIRMNERLGYVIEERWLSLDTPR